MYQTPEEDEPRRKVTNNGKGPLLVSTPAGRRQSSQRPGPVGVLDLSAVTPHAPWRPPPLGRESTPRLARASHGPEVCQPQIYSNSRILA